MWPWGSAPAPCPLYSEARANLRRSPSRIRSLTSLDALALDQPRGWLRREGLALVFNPEQGERPGCGQREGDRDGQRGFL